MKGLPEIYECTCGEKFYSMHDGVEHIKPFNGKDLLNHMLKPPKKTPRYLCSCKKGFIEEWQAKYHISHNPGHEVRPNKELEPQQE